MPPGGPEGGRNAVRKPAQTPIWACFSLESTLRISALRVLKRALKLADRHRENGGLGAVGNLEAHVIRYSGFCRELLGTTQSMLEGGGEIRKVGALPILDQTRRITDVKAIEGHS